VSVTQASRFWTVRGTTGALRPAQHRVVPNRYVQNLLIKGELQAKTSLTYREKKLMEFCDYRPSIRPKGDCFQARQPVRRTPELASLRAPEEPREGQCNRQDRNERGLRITAQMCLERTTEESSRIWVLQPVSVTEVSGDITTPERPGRGARRLALRLEFGEQCRRAKCRVISALGNAKNARSRHTP